jgi:hypothetical protein
LKSFQEHFPKVLEKIFWSPKILIFSLGNHVCAGSTGDSTGSNGGGTGTGGGSTGGSTGTGGGASGPPQKKRIASF